MRGVIRFTNEGKPLQFGWHDGRFRLFFASLPSWGFWFVVRLSDLLFCSFSLHPHCLIEVKVSVHILLIWRYFSRFKRCCDRDRPPCFYRTSRCPRSWRRWEPVETTDHPSFCWWVCRSLDSTSQTALNLRFIRTLSDRWEWYWSEALVMLGFCLIDRWKPMTTCTFRLNMANET